jgi:hypothetical protein
VKAGTYEETIRHIIPAGLSPSARTRIIGNAGAKWTIRPTSAAQCIAGSAGSAVIRHVNIPNVEIADMILNANNLCAFGMQVFGSSNDWWIHDSEFTGWKGSEILHDGSGLSIGTSNSIYPKRALIQNVYSHHGGFGSRDHCFYIKGDGHIIEHVEGAYCSSHGMHMYGGNRTGAKNNRNIVRYSYFHHNGSRGILIGSGNGNQAYGNTVWNNGTSGIVVGHNSPTNNVVYGNIIYSNGGSCIVVQNGSANSIINNNVCWQNSRDAVRNEGRASTITDTRVTNPFPDAGVRPIGPPAIRK